MEQGTHRFKVNFSGILGLLSQHLYASTDVFVRELIQNAHDAIQFRQLTDPHFEASGYIQFEYVDQEDGPLLIVEDNGCGMNMEEVEEFLSRIGSSSKRGLDAFSDEGLIGQFGIGLLSCFMVSDRITLITKSFKEEKAVKWEAFIDGTYTSTPASADFRTGTKLFLPLRKEEADTYSSDYLHTLVKRYSAFLPLQVSFQVGEDEEVLSENRFPWDGLSGEVLGFGQKWFGLDFKHAIPLQSQSGKTQGMAYIFPGSIAQSAKVPHEVYIKNMLITQRSENILPDWFFFARAIVNSEELVPTASREAIHDNAILKQVQRDFEACIARHFAQLAQTSPDILDDIIQTHEMAIKAFAMENPDFYRLIVGRLKMPTSQGRLNLDTIMSRSKTILYVDDLDKFRQLKPMLAANGQLVVNSGYVYDTGILMRLPHIFPEVEVKLLDDLNFSDVFHTLEWKLENELQGLKVKMQEVLNAFKCEVILKKFDPHSIPGIYHITHQQQMTRDLERSSNLNQDSIWGEALGSMAEAQKYHYASQLYVNVENPLIKRLAVELAHPNLKDFVELIYVNALLLGHFTPNEEERTILNTNLIHLIENQLSA